MIPAGRRIVRYGALLALFLIPFGTKKFVFQFFGGSPTELNAAFIFLSTLAAACFIACLPQSSFRIFPRTLLAFVALAALSAGFSTVPLFSAFRLLELCVAVFFGFGIAYALREKIISVSDAARAIAYSACIQAFVVFAQFYSQASLGLRSLGESVIPFGKTEGVARVALEGTALLRGYGTMAHANIAAAWMGLGVICLLFLFIYEGRSALSASIHAAAGLFLLFTGMVLTFSRSGWVSVACAILAFLAVLFFTFPKKDAVRAVLLCALAASAVFFPLRWAIFPRAHLSSGEPSVNLRVLYNSIGIEVMREKPFGTGMADEPRYAETRGLFEKFGIRNPLDFQPVHNLYLLIGTELGVAGLLLLLFFLGSLFRSVGGIAPELRALSISLFAFVAVFALFDHFFWTLEAGRLMFWGALGIAGFGLATRRRRVLS
jgi:O-antigen ligase